MAMNLLYIDPGTGSMLFTILIGVLGTAFYFLRNALVKLRFLLGGGGKQGGGPEHLPVVIFADSKHYWNQFEPICREFDRRGERLVYLTASPDDPALKVEFTHVECRFIGEGNKAFSYLNFLQADVLLSTTPGLDVYQWKRSRGVGWYVHILHAPSEVTVYRMFGIDYYDALLLSGEYQIRQVRELERLRALPAKELRLVGMPYLDTMRERMLADGPVPQHPVTVLLAPSWGASGILSRYGSEIIRALLDTGWHIIIRPHPQSFTAEKELMESLMREFPDSGQLEWNRDNDNYPVLRRSDIMISDFSGVIFDYSLVFGRPVIYADTEFDKSPYDACWLNEELWTFKVLPKIGKQLEPKEFGRLKEVIGDMLGNPAYEEAIEETRIECWAHIGRSAALTADYLIEKRKEILREKEASQADKKAAGSGKEVLT